MTMANILAFTTPADAPRPETMSDALKLLTALGDPKGTAAAVKRLSEAAAEAREQIAEAEAVLADLDRKSAALDQRFATVDDVIAKKQADADRRIGDERAAHEEAVAARVKALEQRERQVEELRSHNIKLHDDLERRISIMRSASV